MPELSPKPFVETQLAFAAHIRDPSANPAPADIEDRRMAIYRDLFYNNVASLLATNFPVLRKILPDDHWHSLIRDFYARHRCTTPLFLEIAQEFLSYLKSERVAAAGDPPFMLELAHYEWVELALTVSDQELDPSMADPNGDLLSGQPVLSPLAWPLSYAYPVHRIAPDSLPQEPGEQPTHLVVYRDRQDDVSFLEVNAVTQRMLELIGSDAPLTGHDVLSTIAEELAHPNPESVVQAGRGLLTDLRRRDILLGTRRSGG